MVAIIVALAVDHEDFFDGNPTALQQADLFCLFVFDGSFTAERIEVVFAESFLLKLPGGLRHGHSYAHLRPYHVAAIGHAIEFAGDELEAGIAEGGAAVVDDGDPTVEVSVLVVARDGENVIGVPGQIAGEVGGFNLLLFRAGVFQGHQKSRTLVEIGGHFRKAIAFGIDSSDYVVANFPNGTVVVGKQSRFDFFALGGAALLV